MVTTLAEAVALQERLVAGDAPRERLTRQRFADYAEQWMKLHAGHLAPSTREKYANSLAHAITAFGGYFVDGISAGDVRSWLARNNVEFAAPTLNDWLRILREALDDAVADGLLASNPARAVKALPEGRTSGKRGTALTLDEFRRLLAAIGSLAGRGELSGDVARLVTVIAWTGMRIGEALALKWDAVVDGEIHVKRSVWRGEEKGTKSGEPRRVAVVDPVRVALEEQRRWLMATQHPALATGIVFPADRGHAAAGAKRRRTGEVNWHRSPSVLASPLSTAAAAAGVPEVSPHSLRRTFENLARLAGVDQMVRRSLAGWRSEKAQAIYAGVGRDEREKAGAAMLKLVSEDGGR